MSTLKNKRIAILTENGFEEVELTSPKHALEEAGATVEIISPQKEKVRAWDHDKWGDDYKVDKTLENASVKDYDALVLPGGVLNPDALRTNKVAVSFAKSFSDAGKPIAAICHGPQLLIETGFLKGKKATSVPALRSDVSNAGADWEDQQVVYDSGLITSRTPKDLDAFNKEIINILSATN